MTWKVHLGDCLDVMRTLPECSVDAIVTDPPYGLAFMGKAWDHAVPGPEFFAEMLRVAKPGAHLFAFGGTRLYHRMTCAIEDAGWEVRDCLSWLYGSGFPKSTRINRDPRFCQCGAPAHSAGSTSRGPQTGDHTDTEEPSGRGALRCEGVPRSTDTPEGSPGDCRLDHDSGDGPPLGAAAFGQAFAPLPQCAPAHSRSAAPDDGLGGGSADSPFRAQCTSPHASKSSGRPTSASGGPQRTSLARTSPVDTSGTSGHTPDTTEDYACREYVPGLPRCQVCGKPNVDGYGTALKPAWEPIVLAMKPTDGTFAANAEKWGVAGLHIDGGRIAIADGDSWNVPAADMRRVNPARAASANGSPGAGRHESQRHTPRLGRWPANLVLDEEAAAMLDAEVGERSSGSRAAGVRTGLGYHGADGDGGPAIKASAGGPSRFFYTGKASSEERTDNNTHPTVKPTDLMRWLVRLAKPPGGGVILDPFTGSGSTGVACVLEGCSFIGIEREPEYQRIAEARIARAMKTGPEVLGKTEHGETVVQRGLFE